MSNKSETNVSFRAPLPNEVFSSSSIKGYLADYATAVQAAIPKIDGQMLQEFVSLLKKTSDLGGRAYVIGNGGSAAIADHLCCDFTKGTSGVGWKSIKTQSLASSISLYSALANDNGFQNVFSKQIEMLADKNDILIAISSSGNSVNILEGVKKAKAMGLKTVGLTGFSGGELKTISDIPIHIEVNNYGIVEDMHQMIMHSIAQFIAIERTKKL